MKKKDKKKIREAHKQIAKDFEYAYDEKTDKSFITINKNPLPIPVEQEYTSPLSDEEFDKLRHSESNIKEGKYPIDLKFLHKKYKELLYIEDLNRIDIVLATALSNKFDGIPIWLLIVGASGDGKTMQVKAVCDDDTFILNNLTSKTLVNGYKDKEKHPDLAPLLDGRLVVIPDMAQILKLPPVDKAEVWGQLRDLYDGYAGKASGQGVVTNYKDLKITLIGCSTPSIDGQLLIHQDLGTRELIYRTSGSKNKEKIMQKCLENEEYEEEINKELKEITNAFLKNREIKRIDPPKEIVSELKNIAQYVTYMRATAEFDYQNELRNFVYPEEPTRIIKQMKRIYISLKSLDDNYPDKRTLKILWHLAKSSAFPIRVKIFKFLKDNKEEEFSTSQISEALKIGKSTSKRECSVFENMGLISCKRKETSFPDRFYEYWKFQREPSRDIVEGMIDEREYSIVSTISVDTFECIESFNVVIEKDNKPFNLGGVPGQKFDKKHFGDEPDKIIDILIKERKVKGI